MKRKGKQNLARVLAFLLLFVTVFQSMPVNAYAASSDTAIISQGNETDENITAASVSGDNALLPTVSGNYKAGGTFDTIGNGVWKIKASASHGNNHPHQAGTKAFFAVCDENTRVTNQDFSVTMTALSERGESGKCTRGGFMFKYVDDTEYSFIGWEFNKWFLQRNGGYEDLPGIDVPEKGDKFTISGHWLENGSLQITVENLTKGTEPQTAEAQNAKMIEVLSGLGK